MAATDRSELSPTWVSLAGLTPVFVAAENLVSGLVLAGAFLLAHSTCSAMSLFMPRMLSKPRGFALSMLGGALSLTLYASIIRILDPFLFEDLYARIFLVGFIAPVLNASLIPNGEAERERGWENVVRGLALSLAVVAFAFARELLATGFASLTGPRSSGSGSLMPFAMHPAGAFILLAFIAAAARAVTGRIRRKEP